MPCAVSVSGGRKYLDDLEAWVLEQGKVVSYRWLAGVLCVNTDTAKRMLFDFVRQRKDVVAIYLITGKIKGTSYCAKLTMDESLADAKRDFSSISSVHVYSVARKNSRAVFDVVAAADFDQAREFLCSSEGEAFRRNRGAINLQHLRVAPPGERELAVAEAIAEAKDPARTTTIQLVTNDSSKIKNRKASSSASFFAKQTELMDNLKPSESGSNAVHEDEGSAMSPGSKRKRSEELDPTSPVNEVVHQSNALNVLESEEEAEWDGAESLKPKVSNSSSCKRIKNLEGSPSTVVNKLEPQPKMPHVEVSTLQVKPKEGKRKKNASQESSLNENDSERLTPDVVVGAMDGFINMQDGPLDPNTLPANPPIAIKKLVQKTFTDEKGYLVTENVWEDIVDEEAVETSKHSTLQAQSKPKFVSSGPSKVKKTVPGNQKSISSFFGRK